MYPYYEVKEFEKTYFYSISEFDNLNFPPHLHSYVELVYIKEGNVNVIINNNSKELVKGELAIIFPDDIHSYNTEIYSKGILLIFSPKIIGTFFNSIGGKTLENPYFFKDICQGKINVFLNMLLEYEDNSNEYIIKGLLYAIFGALSSNFEYRKTDKFYDSTLQIVLKYISKYYLNNISLDVMAKDLGYSKFYLSRVFNNKVGCNINDYINKLRINRAQEYLKNTNMKVFDIALECGFESLRNFNRVFKNSTGLAPTKWKKSN
ncbi:MAG: AraC family transcriptional regulator [Clostridiaceae bacterium]